MAECGICKLNPSGLPWNGCPHEGRGCIDCGEKCRKPAIYIGGMNICAKHSEAIFNRLQNVFPLKIDNVFVKVPWGWQKKLTKEDEMRSSRV